MEYPWVRTSFKVSWAKTDRGAKLDHESNPFQKYLEWLLMELQYVIAAMTEIEESHKFGFRDAAPAVTAVDLAMFSQLKKAVDQCIDR